MRVASVLRTQGAVSCCPRVAPLIFSPSHDAPPTKLGRLPGLAALPVAQSLRGEAPATALRNTYRSYQARHIPWMGKLPRNRSTGQIDFLFFGCFAQLAQSPGFDLADPLLGDSQLRPHLLERQGLRIRSTWASRCNWADSSSSWSVRSSSVALNSSLKLVRKRSWRRCSSGMVRAKFFMIAQVA